MSIKEKHISSFFWGIFCGTGLFLFSENIGYCFLKNIFLGILKSVAALTLIYIGSALVMKEKNDSINSVKFFMFALGIILIFFICSRQINIYNIF